MTEPAVPWTIRAASERDLHVLARTHRLTATYAFAGIFPPEAPVPSTEERLGWTLIGERKPVYAPGRIDDVEYAIELR